MRIALVCPYSLTVPGGVQGQVIGLAAALRATGQHVDVIAPTRGAVVPGVLGVGRSMRFRVNGSTAAMAPLPTPLVRTRRLLRDGSYDIVHVHEPLAPSINLAALTNRSTPVVGTFHAAGTKTPYRWCAPVLRPLAGRLDTRIAVSAAARDLAARYLGGTYEVLFNGIDPTLYRCPDAAGPSSTGTPPTVLFIGRHEERKGLAVLLEAFAAVRQDVRLDIVGDGPQSGTLQRRTSDDPRISWLGPVSEEQKRSLLRRATVLCAPSLHGESFGMVLLEAMAAGCPVIASDIDGYRDVFAHRPSAALLVSPGDSTALQQAIDSLLADEALRRRSVEAGTALVGEFEMNRLAMRYLEVYQRCLEARPSRRER